MSVIDNIIENHTSHEVDDYTGASLQSTVTHNHTQIKYKIILFFGYDKNRNTISETIEITETQYLKLTKEVVEKNNSILSDTSKILSDDELFGKKSLRVRNDSTLPIPTTSTLNTSTLNIKKYKNYKKETLDDLIEHRQILKKPIKTDRMLTGLLNSLERYAKHWKITFDEACEFYLSQSWISIDPEYKYTGRFIKEQTEDLSFNDIKNKLMDAKRRMN